jgi:N-acetylglutamate synthase
VTRERDDPAPPALAGEAIAPFVIDDWNEALPLWRAAGFRIGAAETRDGVARYLERNPGLGMVARVDGVLAGTVLAGHDGRRGYLHHVAVAAPFRRRGLGVRMVERALQALRAAGMERVHLFVQRDNAEGLAFWRAAGWGVRDDLVMMTHER